MVDEKDYIHEGSDTRRLDRVETEVDALRSSVSEMRSDIRSVVGMVGEIKDALKTRDHRDAQAQIANRPPIVAIVSVLVAVVSALIGGAWVIGYSLGGLNERDDQRDKELSRMHGEMDRMEARQWNRRAAQ